VIATDFGYVVHLTAPGGEETMVPNFRYLELAVGDVFQYGGHDWTVSALDIHETETTSFEVWAEPVEPPKEPTTEPPLEPPTEPPPGPLEPPTEPWPEPPAEPPLVPPAPPVR
jgi:hypothetical protein